MHSKVVEAATVTPQPGSAQNGSAQEEVRTALTAPAWWIPAATTVVAVAAILRLYEITLKPLHHDEGVNGLFLLGLFREGIYRYNAANYHGPTLYYFGLITCSINNLLFGAEGPSTTAIRMVPALFGIGVTALLLSLRTRVGNTGTLLAAALAAVSPGMVYFSRDFIHETLLVFFTFWLVVCGLRYWDTGKTRDLLLGSIALALMVCTKETAVISLVALGISAGLALAWIPEPRKMTAKYWGGWRKLSLLAIAAFALCLVMGFLFYSSFFGNYPQGVRDAITTFQYWIPTGITQQATPWNTYMIWLFQEEAPIVVLGVIGTVLAFIQRRNRCVFFAGIWALTLLAGYSMLPYKKPWIMLNVILPLCIPAGYLLQKLGNLAGRKRGSLTRGLVVALIALALATCLYQSIQLNFLHYDDIHYPYAYVQTRRGFLDLIAQVDRISQTSGTGASTSIVIVSPEYWPLPWYLRDYTSVGYYDHVLPATTTIVIGSHRQESELRLRLAGRYQLVGSYPLRPGVDLVLFVTNRQAH